MEQLPSDDVELADWLLAQWDEGRGRPKSHLEKEAWGDESSHGRHFDRFIRQVLGVETAVPSNQSDRIAELADQVRSLGGKPRGSEPLVWEQQLQHARSAAAAAVRAWNAPVDGARLQPFGDAFRQAWAALSIAVLQKGEESAEAARALPGRGDQSVEELLVAAFAGDQHRGLRRNVGFWSELRRALGYRHLPALESLVTPQVQAGLLNLETRLVAEFGADYSLGRSLAVPLELAGFAAGQRSLPPKAILPTLPDEVQAVFAQYGQPDLVEDPTFAFRVAAVPIAAAPVADMEAVVFHGRHGEVAAEVDQAIQQHLVVRQRVRPPRPNLIARDVVTLVQARIPFRFTMNGHTEATYRLKVRARRGDNAPDAVDPEFCEWVSSVKRHMFNERWVERLIEVLSTEAGYQKAVGRKPEPLGSEPLG